MRILFSLLAPILMVAAPAHADSYANDPAHRLYVAEADARADVERAFAAARESGRRVLVVFGANWCHDSRALVAHFGTPEIADYLGAHFEVVYVDVDTPQMGHGRNLDLAAELGQAEVVGTPTVVLLDAARTRINREDTATAWRNADSRDSAEVLAELRRYAEWDYCYPMPVSAGPGEPYVAPDCSTHARP